MKHFFLADCSAAGRFSGSAQTTHPKLKGWHLLNYQQDGYMGTGVKEAYELLKGRKSTTVIMAVIDSGVDTAQEDLRPNLWVNPKKFPVMAKMMMAMDILMISMAGISAEVRPVKT